MPILDELNRRLMQMFAKPPAELGGYVPGQAQTRLGHQPAFVLTDDEYQKALSNFGEGGELGLTLIPNGKPSIGDYVRTTLGGPTQRAILRSYTAGGFPSIVPASDTQALGHEAIHGYLAGGKEPSYSEVLGILPEAARKVLQQYYSPQDMAQEVPARATTNPGSMNLSSEEGRSLMGRYLQLLQRSDPERAKRLSRYVTPKMEHSFQRPNDVF